MGAEGSKSLTNDSRIEGSMKGFHALIFHYSIKRIVASSKLHSGSIGSELIFFNSYYVYTAKFPFWVES